MVQELAAGANMERVDGSARAERLGVHRIASQTRRQDDIWVSREMDPFGVDNSSNASLARDLEERTTPHYPPARQAKAAGQLAYHPTIQ
jgi:hypothetical protein